MWRRTGSLPEDLIRGRGWVWNQPSTRRRWCRMEARLNGIGQRCIVGVNQRHLQVKLRRHHTPQTKQTQLTQLRGRFSEGFFSGSHGWGPRQQEPGRVQSSKALIRTRVYPGASSWSRTDSRVDSSWLFRFTLSSGAFLYLHIQSRWFRTFIPTLI